MLLLAALAAGGAVLVLRRSPAVRRLGAVASGQPVAAARPVLGRAVAAAAVGWAVVGPLGAAAAPVAVTVHARAARRRQERPDPARTLHALLILLAELRAGRQPVDAVAAAASVADEPSAGALREAAAALRLGGDPAPFLRAAADPTGALRRLATGWEVSTRAGAGLAVVVDAIAEDIRAGVRQRREVRAQLAGPRATAWILAALPAIGIVFSAGLGADPRDVLLGTPIGLACLLLGAALDATGVVWVRRIARAAEAA